MPLESDGFETLRLLDALEAEVRLLKSKTKRLSVALDRANKKIGVLEERKQTKARGVTQKKQDEAEVRSGAPAADDSVSTERRTPRKRQALGRGLAQIRSRYPRSGEETVDIPDKGSTGG